MVSISVQPASSGLGTVGITGIFAIGLKQIVTLEYLVALVSQLAQTAV